jgi:hypothetical protein
LGESAAGGFPKTSSRQGAGRSLAMVRT